MYTIRKMRGPWVPVLIVVLLLLLGYWTESMTFGAFAVFMAAWFWGGLAGLGAAVVAWLMYLGHGMSDRTMLLDALGLAFVAAGGHLLKRRADALALRQARIRGSLRAILHASKRVARFEDPDELLRRAPRFFEEGPARGACVLRVEGDEIRVESGDCRPEEWREPLLRASQGDEPLYLDGGGRGPYRFLVPMCDRYVLCVEPAGPLEEDERDLITAFANLVCLVRRRLQENREAEQFSRLMTALASSRSLSEASEKVIQLLLPVLGASGGLVVIFRGGRFEPLAMVGRIPAAERELLENGLPAGWGGVWRSYIQRRPLFIEDYGAFDLKVESVYEAGVQSLAFLPVSGERRARIVLVIQDDKVRSWEDEEREFLVLVARGLGLMAEQFLTRERMNALLRLEREVFDSPIELAYDRLLAYAVRLVPGGEAGSLLVRTPEDDFRYTASLGYEQEGLKKIRFSLEDVRDVWYGAGDEAWLRGEPRVFSAVEQDIAEVSYKTAPIEVIDQAGRVREIKANLCLPIVYQGEVLAVLNIESFSDPEAFDDESVEAARVFAQQAALLLHEQHYRNLLERAAHTDPLTGLPNRRAFDEEFAVMWQSAERYGYPLSVLVMDLSRFKEINDRYGHAAGDQVLVRVGRVLSEITRNGDRIFRWGGDEFAVLMPHTVLLGAVRAAERYARAIEQVCVETTCVGVNIGAAAFPEDTRDPAELIKLADARMYQAKRSGLVVEPRS